MPKNDVKMRKFSLYAPIISGGSMGCAPSLKKYFSSPILASNLLEYLLLLPHNDSSSSDFEVT